VARVKGQGQGQTHRVSSLRTFCRPKNTFTAESWNSRSRVPCFLRTHFLLFGGLKMRFLPSREPMLQELVASCEHIFSFMATWKCCFNSRSMFKGHEKRPNSWPGSKVKVKHERHIAWAHFVQFGSLKIYLLPSLETHVQGYVAWWKLIIFILAAWKYDYCRVVKPMLQEFVASFEHIFSFMATWKCDSLNSLSCEKTKFAARVKGQGKTRITHRVRSLRAFWRPENTFTAESWKSRSESWNPCFMKIYLLPSLETHV